MGYRDIRTKFGFWLEYLGLRVGVSLLECLGVDRASATMGWIWRKFAPYNPRHGRADRHLRLAMPQLSVAERSRVLGDMWESLGRTFAEGLLLPKVIRKPERVEISAELAAALAECRGSGIVFCSLHQGNWELLAFAGSKLGIPVAGIYRALRNPYSEEYFRTLRVDTYAAGLVSAGAASALRLRSIARSGSAIAMMADLPDDTGIVADFFGYPSHLSKLPVTLARHLGLPIVVARCRRTSGVHFITEGRRLEIKRTDNADSDIAEGTKALHAVFEDWIRDEPGQWMWATRKWREDDLRKV